MAGAEVLVVPDTHQGVVEMALGLGVEGERQLVVLDVAVLVLERDQVDGDPWLVGDRAGHLAETVDPGQGERPTLAAEPASALDEGGQVLAGVGGRAGAGHIGLPSSVFGLVSRNQ